MLVARAPRSLIRTEALTIIRCRVPGSSSLMIMLYTIELISVLYFRPHDPPQPVTPGRRAT